MTTTDAASIRVKEGKGEPTSATNCFVPWIAAVEIESKLGFEGRQRHRLEICLRGGSWLGNEAPSTFRLPTFMYTNPSTQAKGSKFIQCRHV